MLTDNTTTERRVQSTAVGDDETWVLSSPSSFTVNNLMFLLEKLWTRGRILWDIYFNCLHTSMKQDGWSTALPQAVETSPSWSMVLLHGGRNQNLKMEGNLRGGKWHDASTGVPSRAEPSRSGFVVSERPIRVQFESKYSVATLESFGKIDRNT